MAVTMEKTTGKTITKEKLTFLLQKRLGFSGSLCEDIVNNIFAEMLDLSLNGKLLLMNFGKFQVYNKPQRPAMNLRTGAKLNLESRKVLRFNAARSFKEKVNSYEPESDRK